MINSERLPEETNGFTQANEIKRALDNPADDITVYTLEPPERLRSPSNYTSGFFQNINYSSEGNSISSTIFEARVLSHSRLKEVYDSQMNDEYDDHPDVAINGVDIPVKNLRYSLDVQFKQAKLDMLTPARDEEVLQMYAKLYMVMLETHQDLDGLEGFNGIVGLTHPTPLPDRPAWTSMLKCEFKLADIMTDGQFNEEKLLQLFKEKLRIPEPKA